MVEMSDRSVKSSKKYSEEIEDDHELAKAEKQNSCFCSFCWFFTFPSLRKYYV